MIVCLADAGMERTVVGLNKKLKQELDVIWERMKVEIERGKLGVVLPVGMIGSGKSTVGKYFLHEGFLIAYEDMLIRSFHGGEYDYQVSMQMQYLGAMREVAAYWLGEGRSVVVDSTNHTIVRRADVIRRVGEVRGREGVVIVGIELPRMEARRHAEIRIGHNTRGYAVERWYRVADEHAEEYEGLQEDEGFDWVFKLGDVFSL